MRILFLHSIFPGPFRLLAAELGCDPANTVLFLSESGQKGCLPGVRRLRMAPPLRYQSDDVAEREAVKRLRRAARAGNVMLGLRKDGFMPDLAIATSSTAGSFYLRDIFPDAFMVVQADWFYNRGESHCFFNRGRSRPSVDFAPARVRNAWEYNALGDADMAIISSEWQRRQYPDFLADRLEVVHGGIDTVFFSPASLRGFASDGLDLSDVRELVSFSGPPRDATRGFAQFAKCLPHLLEARTDCHVLIAWPEPGSNRVRPGSVPSDMADIEHASVCLGRLPLDESARERIHLVGACPLASYRKMLRSSTVHVYLTAPFALSTGILEAMACGSLVVGSATEPVREVLQDGVNGFLCDFWDGDAMAATVARVLARADSHENVRMLARRTVLEHYEIRAQVARIKQGIFARMKGRDH